MRHLFFKTGNEDLKTKYRIVFSRVCDIIDSDIVPSRMTQYSFELFRRENCESLFEKRRKNAKALIKVLANYPKIIILQESIDVSNLYVPLVVNDRDEIQRKLNALGIFNTIIWPIRDEQKNICENAKYIEEHMLAAPCDQRYSTDDMEYIGNEIVRIINE